MKRTKIVAISDAQTIQMEFAMNGYHTVVSTSGEDSLKIVGITIFYDGTEAEKKHLEKMLKQHLKDGDTYECKGKDYFSWITVEIEHI